MKSDEKREERKGNLIENWDDSYREFATTYSEKIVNPANLAMNIGYEMVYNDIQKYLPHYSNSKVLEVGCGGARTSLFLALRGFDVTCTDFAPDAIRLANSNFTAMGATGKIVQDDLLNSKLPRESFDCVMSFGLLEHFEDLRPVIKSITMLVKPGGIQIHNIITKKFSTQTIMNAFWFPFRFINNAIIKKDYKDILRKSYRDFPHFENTFSYSDYCECFIDEGNAVLRCSPGGVLFPFLALPLNVGNFIVKKFLNSLYSLFKLANNTEIRLLHLVSPTFYIVTKKNKTS